MISEIKVEDIRHVEVHTRNTIYKFDRVGNELIGLATRRHDVGPARYMDIPTNDVEISGTKMTYAPWDYLIDGNSRHDGKIVKGGLLRFRYPGHSAFVTTSEIEKIVDLTTLELDNESL